MKLIKLIEKPVSVRRTHAIFGWLMRKSSIKPPKLLGFNNN